MNSRFSFFDTTKNAHYLRLANEVARRARESGNNPFGALLVDEAGNVLLESGNVELTEHDCTGHAETTLMRMASRKYAPAFYGTAPFTRRRSPAPCAAGPYTGGIWAGLFTASTKKPC